MEKIVSDSTIACPPARVLNWSAPPAEADAPLDGLAGTVLIHLLAAAITRRHQPQQPTSPPTPSISSPATPTGPPIQSVYIRCTSPFPQVESFVTVCVDRYNLELEVAEGNMRDALAHYLDKRKADVGEQGEIKAVLVGTRRNDPHGGQLLGPEPCGAPPPRGLESE